MAAVGIGQVGAEGRDFGHEAGIFRLRRNQDHSEVRAHGKGPRKQVEHHVGRRAGGHVVVGRLAPQQQIAHASAGEIRLVPRARSVSTIRKAASNWPCAAHRRCFYSSPRARVPLGQRAQRSRTNTVWPAPHEYTENMPGSGLILGIESSCDETAAAIVERGARTVSSVVASQIATHARYGGVVPELASREHLRAIVPVVRAALAEAHLTLADLDAIAVTSGPGLAGALLVGITYAKAWPSRIIFH